MATSMGTLSKYLPAIPGTETIGLPPKKKTKTQLKRARKQLRNKQNKLKLKMKQNHLPIYQAPCPSSDLSPMQDVEGNLMTYQGCCPQNISMPMCFPTENNQNNFNGYHGPGPQEHLVNRPMHRQQTENHDNFASFHNPCPPDRFNPNHLQTEDHNNYHNVGLHNPYPPDHFHPIHLQTKDRNNFQPYPPEQLGLNNSQLDNQNNFQMFHNPYPPEHVGPMHLQSEENSNNFRAFHGVYSQDHSSPMCMSAEDSDLTPFHNPYPPEQPSPVSLNACNTKHGLLPTPPPDKYIGPPLMHPIGSRPPEEQSLLGPYQSPPLWNHFGTNQHPTVPDMSPHYNKFPGNQTRHNAQQLIENTLAPQPPKYYNQPPPPTLPPPPLPPPPDEPPPPSPPPQETFQYPDQPHALGLPAGLLTIATKPTVSVNHSIVQVLPSIKELGSVDVIVRPPTTHMPQPPRKKAKVQAPPVSTIPVTSTTKHKPTKSKKKKSDLKRIKEMQRRERKRKHLIRLKNEAKYKKMNKQEGAMLRKNPYIDLEEIRLVTADISIKSIKISTNSVKLPVSMLEPKKGILVSAGFRRENAGEKDGEQKVVKTVRFAESEKPKGEVLRPRIATKKKLCSKDRKEKAARRAARQAKKRTLAACMLLPPPPPPSFEPPPCLRLIVAREAPAGLMWAQHKFRVKKSSVNELLSTVAQNPQSTMESGPAPQLLLPPVTSALVERPHSLIQPLEALQVQEHSKQISLSPASPFEYRVSKQRSLPPRAQPALRTALPLKFSLSQIKGVSQRVGCSPVASTEKGNVDRTSNSYTKSFAARTYVPRGPQTPPQDPPDSPPDASPETNNGLKPWENGSRNSRPRSIHTGQFAYPPKQRRHPSPLTYHRGGSTPSRCNGEGIVSLSPPSPPYFSPHSTTVQPSPGLHPKALENKFRPQSTRGVYFDSMSPLHYRPTQSPNLKRHSRFSASKY